jgi:small multidrug resistance family-3 protein
MKAALLYSLTALPEIAGCYAFFAVTRVGKSALWPLPGLGALAFFAWLLRMSQVSETGFSALRGVFVSGATHYRLPKRC